MSEESSIRLEGSLGAGGLIDVFLALERDRSTGILTVQGNLEIVGLSLLDGRLVSADALNQSLEEALGELLSERDLVSREVLADLAAEHQAGGGRVLDLLVERGYLKRNELLEVLRLHIMRLCSQVMSWTEGEFKFYRGEEVSHEDGIRPIEIDELLLAKARDRVRRGTGGGPVPGPATVFERTSAQASEEGAAAVLDELLTADPALSGVAREAMTLLAAVDGRTPTAELARGSGLSEHRALLLCYRLQEGGLIRPAGGAEPPRPAPVAGAAPAEPPGVGAPRAEPPEIPASDTGGAAAAPPAVSAPVADVPIAEPPLEVAPPAARARSARARHPARLVRPGPWPTRILGLALAAALGAVLVLAPERLTLPFPWQGEQREARADLRGQAILLRIERAAEVFFLLEGRYPEDLAELGGRGLIAPRDGIGREPGGGLAYSASVASFSLRPEGEDPAPELTRTETVVGNFLLDPEFVDRSRGGVAPLVLLD